MPPPTLRWGEQTYVMGVVNVTPDSFSGDGLAAPGADERDVVAAALAQARAFVEDGAQILDVGGESTRPRHAYGDRVAVDTDTELARTEPVVRALVAELGDRALVSIDTSRGAVARAALTAGARMVNDVWGARRDQDTARAAAEAGAHLVLMHNQDEPGYPDGVFATVARWLNEAVDAALATGMPRERLLVDPGIGFGKSPDDTLELLHRLRELKEALGGLPLLVGTSRKKFIGELLGGAPPDERVEGTAASVALAIAGGADVVRVHDVAHMVRTVRVADAIVRRGAGVTHADRLTLRGMRFRGRHGALPGERETPQPFEVDLVLHADLSDAAERDDLTATIDYSGLFELTRGIVEERSFALIEALAGAIAAAALAVTSPQLVAAVEVRVRKPEAPLPGTLDTVETTIVRRRE